MISCKSRLARMAPVALIALIPVLASCGAEGDPAEAAEPVTAEATATESTGTVVPVIALDNSFRPQALEIHVGDTVEFENRGNNDHNVLSIEGDAWGVEVTEFAPGEVYTHTFTEPGDYAYFCSIHGTQQAGMLGTITVTA